MQWVIVGASSGIAKAFSRVAASQGADIILVGRNSNDLETLRHDLVIRYEIQCQIHVLDILDIQSYSLLIETIQSSTSSETVTHLFFACGIMLDENTIEADAIQKMLNTNFVNPAIFLYQWVNAFKLPLGSVVVLGSVAGDRGRARNAFYGASKAGLEAYVQGLRARVAERGIHVLLVKPGPIDTKMSYGKPMPLCASPEACAKACWKAYLKKRLVIYYPGFWRWVMFIVRNLPACIFHRLKV